MNRYFTLIEVANTLGVSKAIVEGWSKNGRLTPVELDGQKFYSERQLLSFDIYRQLAETKWDKEKTVEAARPFRSIELFAGAGGLALGLEGVGFEVALLNELDRHAGATLKKNRPDWNVAVGDIAEIDFTPYKNKIDLLSGGFPCQAFSYAGNKLGFGDIRGTLFFELMRAVEEVQPRVFLGENVRGLLNHDNGRTLETIKHKIEAIGYTLIAPQVLKAIYYKVPQKRERLFLVGIRNDLVSDMTFHWPSPYRRVLTLKDALKKGEIFATDVPASAGQTYPVRKKEILDLVPPGGYWRDLPDRIQREYMQKSYFLGGGKTGMARRLSWDEPSLTLTCAPAQKQTERCHPEETRPLTVREYARIQTFPDNWEFTGSISSQYKQIGNAVPVNLAIAVGRSLITLLNQIDKKYPTENTEEIPEWNMTPEQIAFIWERRRKYQLATEIK
ncbi:MAG: DNA (cytosine-5-)-methyltransferase [Pseudomonadota bacterium]|nr:DNA (cytosine-5-)-methyltransferase [Pseudomonadota bacterium]